MLDQVTGLPFLVRYMIHIENSGYIASKVDRLTEPNLVEMRRGEDKSEVFRVQLTFTTPHR